MLTCSKCKQAKDFEAFARNRAKASGYSSYCKICMSDCTKNMSEEKQRARRAKQKEWTKSNPDRVNKAQKRYQAKFENFYEEKIKPRKYYLNRPKRTCRKEEGRRRYQNNKEYFYAKAAERRALKNKAIPPWADLDAIRSLYAEARKRNEAGEAVHVDHIVPLRGETVCGLHVLANLRIVSAAENRSKNNRHWPDMP